MLRRIATLAALATATLFAADAQAQLTQVSPLASVAQQGLGNTFQYTRSMNGSGLPVSISIANESNRTLGAIVDFNVNNPAFLVNPAGPTNFTNSRFLLTGTSSEPAAVTNIGSLQARTQTGFVGTFSIIASDGTTNLLSGSFSDATLSQFSNAPGEVTISFGPATFTSSIFQPLADAGFSLTVSGTPSLVRSGSAFQNFAGNTSGTFSGTLAVIPEPASLAMAGLGLLALPFAARVARRRRSS